MEQSSYIVRAGVHLFVMAGEARSLRLRVTRRDEADLGKLIEWVLGIAEARHRAWVAGEPDPYGLQLPNEFAEAPPALRTVRGARENRDQAPLRQGGQP